MHVILAPPRQIPGGKKPDKPPQQQQQQPQAVPSAAGKQPGT
jgi:hypothetical protein